MLSSTGESIIPNKVPKRVYQPHICRYEFAANFVMNKKVLDVACGTGYGSRLLVEKGAETVIGGDLNRVAIEHAKEHNVEQNLHFTWLDATRLPFPDNSFDVITSFETIEHIEKYDAFLSECNRVLKDDGFFICSTPNKLVYSPGLKKPLNPFHVYEFNVQEFGDLLHEHFKDINMYCQTFLTSRNIISYNIYGLATRFLVCTSSGKKIRNIIWKKSMDLKNAMWKKNYSFFSLSLRKENAIDEQQFSVKPLQRMSPSTVAHMIATMHRKQ